MLWSKTYNGLAEVVDCQAVVPRSALAGADVAIASVQCPVPHISSLNSSHCCTLHSYTAWLEKLIRLLGVREDLQHES